MVDADADYSRLAEVVSGLGLHEHLCAIYGTPEEQCAVALPYLKTGLERGEKCLYFGCEKTAAAFLDALRKIGIDVDRYLRSGALTITHKRETDLEQGCFDPHWWMDFINQASAEAGAARGSALRILGDMDWALRGSNSTGKLIEYESSINHFVLDHDARVICQYNRNVNAPELILGIIRTHPMVVYGGLVCKNPYYVPPDEFLKPNQAALEVERLLHNILTWEQAQEALRRSEDQLRLVIDTVPALIHTGRPDGYLDYFNKRWLDYVGLPLEEVAGWKWMAVNHPEDVAATVEEWRRCIATGEPFEHESRLRRADGEYRWMFHRKVPLRDDRGNIVKWYGSSVDIEDRKRAEDGLRAAINERARLSAVRAEIGMALARKGSLREVLQACAEALVQHLDAAFARIWTLSSDGTDLELQASAGMCTRLDGHYSRIPLGDFKIGRIAQERKAHLTNDVQNDPQIRDKVWARAEKITSFAGYPLVVEGQTVGVMGMFSQKPIPESTLDTLSFLGDGIAQGIDRKRAEEALRQSEQLYSKLVNSVDCIVWEADARTLQFSFVSPQAQRMLGYPAELWLVPGFWVEHLHPDDREWCTALFKQATQEGRDHRLEYRMVAADGQTVWLHDVVSVHMGPEGPSRLTGVMIDVTRRKLAEMAAKESGDRFRLVFERSTAGMMICDASEKIIRANKSFCDFLGYSEDELRGRSIIDITYPEDAAKTLAYLEESRQHKAPSYDLEKRYVRKSGEVAWGRASSVFLLPEGRPPCWVAVVLDISERKRPEEALRVSEERWRAVFENSAVGIALSDSRGNYLRSNCAYQEMVGYTDEELRALSYIDITYEEDREIIRDLVAELVEGKRQHFSLEKRNRRKDGTLIWVRVTVSEAHDTDGKFQFGMSVVEDITERKRAEDDLRRQKEVLQKIVDNAPVMIAFLAPDSKLSLINREFERTLGWTLEEMRARDLNDLLAQFYPDPTYRQEAMKFMASSTTQFADLRVRVKDGRVVETSWGKVHLSDGTEIYIGRDITERKRGEEDLRRQKEILQKIFDNAPVMIRFLRPDGKTKLVNQEWERTIGWTLEEILGQNLDVFAELYPDPEYRQEVMKFVFSAKSGFADFRTRVRDGRVIDTSWAVVRLSDGTTIGIGLNITERKRAERALRESEERFRIMAHAAPVMIWMSGVDALCTFFNQPWLDFTGRPLEQEIGTGWADSVHPDDLAHCMDTYLKAFKARAKFEMEYRLRRADGEYRWVLDAGTPRFEPPGAFAGYIGSCYDITERKRAEEALRRSEDRLRHIIDTIPIMAWSNGPDGVTDFLNKRWMDYSGLSLEEYVGDPTRPIHPEDIPGGIGKWRAALAAGEPYEYEMRLRRADGEYRWFLVRTVPLRDERGKIVKWYGSSVDIEDRKRAEEELRQTEERIRAILEYSANWIFLKDTEGRYLLVNREVERVFRISQEQIKGKTDSEIFPPEQAAEYRANDLKVLREGLTMEFEEIADLEDGPHISIVHKFPLFDTHGNIYATGGVATDITDRKRAEQALRESEERFRALFDNVQVGVVVSGPNAEVLSSNPAARDLLGVTEGTTSFDPKWQTFYEDGTPCPGPEHPIPRAIATRQPVRNIVLGVDRPTRGDRIWLMVSAQPQISSDGKVTNVICSFEDITERKRAEETLRSSEDRLRRIIDTIPIMAWSSRPDGTVEFLNRPWVDYAGLSLEQYVEEPTRPIHPDDIPRVMGKWRSCMAVGKPYDDEMRLRRADGEYRWFLVRSVPMRDARGDIIKWYGSGVDIEDRRRAEEELGRSEARWRSVFENSAIGVALTDLNGRFLATNPVYQKMVGYNEEELRGLSFLDITQQDHREANWTLIGELLEGRRQQFQIEKQYRRKDGSLIWVRNSVSLVPGAEAVSRFIMALSEDITERKETEEALRRSEAYLAAGQRLSQTGSWALKIRTGELFWSQETFRVFGFEPAKTTASIIETFLPRIHPEDRPKVEERLKAAAIRKGSYEDDYRILLPDGSIKYIHDVVYTVTSDAGDIIERYGVVMDVTERKRAEVELQRSRDRLRALAAQLQRIREDERKRVAREIHDELGQALTAIKIDLTTLLRAAPIENEVEAQRSKSIFKLLDETIQSVRRIATELRPVILDELGLVAAVEWASEEFQDRTGIKCRLDLPQDDVDIDPEPATALFRIFQETLTNVARHAKASEVNVRLAKEDGNLTLEVHDNGKGFSEDQLSAGSSLGITGMRERALLLGGELTITGAVGKGTTVRARIPETYPALAKEGI